ncbi:MAG: glycosyltransferase family 2 protein [Pseudomonadota bacterium]
MTRGPTTPPRTASGFFLPDSLEAAFWNIAASGWIPARWVERNVPGASDRAAETDEISIEIVSHCWNYAHLLIYQLSSLALFPPQNAKVTMTVNYAAEDQETAALLAFFSDQSVRNVSWNWRALPKEALFRRSIGRNDAALHTAADWIWFTDCDLMFRHGCLDQLADALQGCNDILVYPQAEHRTALLADDDPLLRTDLTKLRLIDIDERQFTPYRNGRATGPHQITHGDVARAVGYCNAIRYYLKPQPRFAKCREDRAFRWLCGTDGMPVDIAGVYRIRHAAKGRYAGAGIRTRARKWLRQEKGQTTAPPV